MRRVGQTRKRDTVEPAIVAALERVGATVFKVSGPGVPDLFVWHRERWVAMDCKSPSGRATLTQERRWPAGAVAVVRSPEDAIQEILGP